MFTFKVREQIGKLLTSQEMATPAHPSTKPWLEILEDRTVPSASDLTSMPLVLVASPPAAPQVTTIPSLLVSMMEQRVQVLATLEQAIGSAFNALGQDIAQEVSAVQQQWDHLLGITPTLPTPSLNTTVSQPSSDSGAGRGNASGSGSGSGATTTAHNAPHHTLTNSTQQSGRSSGSGSSATMTGQIPAGAGSPKAHPLVSPGSGSGSGGHNSGSGSATVYGNVWLDSDYDGLVDNGELGYSGATVQLDRVGYGGYLSTTTDQNGNYLFTLPAPSIPPGYTWEVQVIFPFDCFATKPGGDSQITAQGFTQPFNLVAGDVVQKNAGIASMNVDTTADDANNQKIQDKTTLRDAIQTGNNGPPQPAVTFYSAPNTALTGTITLGAQQLDPIKTSYNINGPSAGTLTVNGNNNAGTIFTVNAGVTSTIRGLTITGGSNGGIVNDAGAQLSLQQVSIKNNKATGAGGGVASLGTVTIYDGVVIDSNTSANGGGGIANVGGTISAQSYVEINNNTNTGGGGGGVDNAGGKFQIFDGGSISGNTSAGNGGGVNNIGGTMTLQGVEIGANSSAGNGGGGIFVSSGSVTLTDVYITGKNSANEGGGMYVKGGTVKMSRGGISTNAATYPGRTNRGVLVQGGGGGLYVGGGSVTLTGVSININVASLDGGGVFNDAGGTLTLLYNINIGSNQAIWEGGGMYLANGSTTNFRQVTVSGNVAWAGGKIAVAGSGIYQQNINAVVNPNPPGPPNIELTDNDDPGGNPVVGP